MPDANDAARDIDPARMFESMMGIPQACSQVFDLWRRMAFGAAGSAASSGAVPGGAAGTMFDAASAPPAVANFMAQSYMTVMTCGLRCLSGWAEIHSRYLTSMGRGISTMSGGGPGQSRQDQMVMLDQLRAYLRELMELPYHECGRALADLQMLESSILPQTGAGDPPRRWKAKP